jgi:nucleoside 2-deoxyribosyltransferase
MKMKAEDKQELPRTRTPCTLDAVIYLANGLGFSAITSPAVAAIKARLEQHGFTVFEPFSASKDLGAEIVKLQQSEKNIDILKEKLAAINVKIGKRNAIAIEKSMFIVAILDGGFDVDSGVAAEIGYAAGKSRPIIGLRTDFRPGGDNPGAVVNLQVEYFITRSGGSIVPSVDALIQALSRLQHEN